MAKSDNVMQMAVNIRFINERAIAFVFADLSDSKKSKEWVPILSIVWLADPCSLFLRVTEDGLAD